MTVNYKNLENFFKDNFKKFGVHESSLGWSKGKQFVRFHALTRQFNLNGASILDIGCGFGDFLNFAKSNEISLGHYYGIDIVDDFINVAKEKHFNDSKAVFEKINFKDLKNFKCDYIIASGIFGPKVSDNDIENYANFEEILSKSLDIATKGVAFDFISDKVDFRSSDNDFHASPSKILEIAYKKSKNVILDNSVMPFEFNLIVNKNNDFKVEKTVFDSFIESHFDMFESGKL